MTGQRPSATAPGAPRSGPPPPAVAQHHGIPSAISADLVAPPSRGLSRLMAMLMALIATFIVWAALANVEEFTSGRGRIIPASRIQVVQSLEAGIVREILVREGDMVRAGHVILRIDPTIAGSSVGEAREKMLGLEALIARLEAEVEGREPTFSDEFASQRPDLASHQRTHYESRRRELEGAIAALDGQERQRAQEIAEARQKIETLTRALEIAEQELGILKPLERSRAASKSEVLAAEAKRNDTEGALSATRLAIPRLEAALAEVKGRRAERLEAYRGDSLQKLATARIEHAALSEQNRGSADRLARTTVRAPASGIVKTVSVTTPGQVIQPGHNVVEIVPIDDTLLVEAQVRPQDIAFLRPGQRALVKLTAYDFAIYSGLEGRVEQISADSVTTEKGESYYVVRVRTDKSHLQHGTESLPIIPGMVADVDVVTGSKSVLTYLTKPLTRMRQSALRER